MDPYQELKRLLLQAEQERIQELEERIRQLEEQLDDRDRLIHTIHPIISDIISQKVRDSRDEMADALAPVMGKAIKKQISEAKDEVVDALYPVIGQTIRKSIAEAIKKLVASINQQLDQALSLKSLKLRIKSLFTGIPYKQLMLREVLPFRIRHIYVIQKESGLLIYQLSDSSDSEAAHQEMIGGMLTAIRDFASQAFRSDSPRELTEISYEDLTIYLEDSRYVYFAFVYEGVPPEDFHEQTHQLAHTIHQEFRDFLRQYHGEKDIPEKMHHHLQRFIEQFVEEKTEAREEPAPARSFRKHWKIALYTAIALLLLVGIWQLPGKIKQHRIQQQLAKLKTSESLLNTPGLHFEIDGGTVYVTGKLKNWEERDRLQQMLQDIPGVDSVANQVKVPLTPELLEKLRQRLIQENPQEYAQLHLIADGDVLVLEGPVASRQEGYRLARKLAHLSGVPVIFNATETGITPSLLQFLQEHCIHFPEQSTELSQTEREKIFQIARRLQFVHYRKLRVVGLTRKQAEKNSFFSRANTRAKTVALLLQKSGIPQEKIEIRTANIQEAGTEMGTEPCEVIFRIE